MVVSNSIGDEKSPRGLAPVPCIDKGCFPWPTPASVSRSLKVQDIYDSCELCETWRAVGTNSGGVQGVMVPGTLSAHYGCKRKVARLKPSFLVVLSLGLTLLIFPANECHT
jgi:hypothetical protein